MPEEVTPADSGAIPEEGSPSTGDSPHGDLSAALSSCQITWQHAESWNEFIEALATVETTSMLDGHIALHDVCIALRERIVHLSEVQPCPDDEQCAVLATWPSFASAWAESTGDTRLGELLVEFLRHPMWSRPLGSDEAEVLGVMLGVESGAYGTESLIETVIDTLHTGETDDGDGDGDAGSDSGGGKNGLPGYDGLSGYAKLGAGSAGAGKIVPDVRARISSGIDSGDVEDLSTGTDLGGIQGAEEQDASAPEITPLEHAPSERPSEEPEIQDPRPIETEGVEPELMEHALVEPEFAEPELSESEIAEFELAEPEIAEVLITSRVITDGEQPQTKTHAEVNKQAS